MVNLMIDGKQISVKENTTIMEAAAQNGIPIPKLCYLKGINEIAACRVCVVELEGKEKLITSCNNVAEEGMVIFTNSPKVRRHRRTNVELILSQHDCQCVSCARSGNCSLQSVANSLNILDIPYRKVLEKQPWDQSFPLIRDSSKCIKCMRCVQVCEKIQGLGVWDVEGTGSRTTVNVSNHRSIHEADCSLCGQCITHCPVGALRERDDTEKVWNAIADKNKTVVVQVAPAVRTAWGEELGLKPEEATVGKILDACKRMGADYVFDTTFSADLTIMEEGTEFIERLQKDENLPMFTSCCPAWVRYLEGAHPDMLGHLSTCKSPQSMLSPVLKEVLPLRLPEYTKENLVVVSIMPCTAKKSEAGRSELSMNGIQDTDYVLTTKELGRMIKEAGINFAHLAPSKGDSPFGEYTGAGTIFGASGGVAEAAVRTAYELITQQPLSDCDIKELRGVHNRCRDVEFDINGKKVVVRVVSTLKEAEKSIMEIKKGEAKFQLLEVMACPGGCVNGGGQPKSCDSSLIKEKRARGLYKEDESLLLRKSHENPEIQKLYEEFLEKPGSHKAHELLHTNYKNRLKGSYKDFE